MPGVHVYVYYALAAPPARAHERVARMLGDIEAATGVSGRLLARCDDASTWMEVYDGVADLAAFHGALGAAADRHDIASIARDRVRRVECFGPVMNVDSGRA